MLFARLAQLLLVTGCGRVGFETQRAADQDAIDDSDLRLDLRFDGTLADATGRHTATCTDCPTFAAGRSAAAGMAGVFDGGQCLTIADAPEFRSQAYTAALWIRVLFGSDQTLFTKPFEATLGGENSWEIYLGGAKVQFATSDAAGNQVLTGANVPEDEWHHVAVTFDTGAKRAYFDGELTSTATTTLSQYDGDPVRIGCELDAGVQRQFTKGQLDDVRFYARALSDAEIMMIAQ